MLKPHVCSGLDTRRRKILFRSWHRGMREVDLLLGRFAEVQIASLSDTELDAYESLLEAADRDIFAWLIGEADPPSPYDTSILQKIRAFHAHAAPLHR
ncbi:MAG TPA: succinate dehydrogenase assembly factor 2 [Methylocella sp.]|nr:succinate dehydrogenase assembly factor 2 [Methylocella sp.]